LDYSKAQFMMILGISGSPKKGGNTEYILDEALKVASERGFQTERLLSSALRVEYCDDCGDCARGKPCPIKDDMYKFYELMENAVYFGSVSAQLKSVFDRTILLRRQGFKLKDKVGCAISVGAARNGGQEKTIESIHNWMHMHGMIVVGDDNHFGGIAVRPAHEDRVGRKTIIASANKQCDLLERLKKSNCWGGD
jgi:multimeric flavodoxin WrbA